MKRSERHNGSFATRPIQADSVEVNEGVMFLNVNMGIAQIAGLGHILLIGLPGAAAGFDEIREAGRIDETIMAIGVNPEGVAAYQSNVVRQAGMPHRVILRKQRIFLCQPVVIRHERIPDDGAELLVLEHDNDDMLKVRNKR